MIGMARDEFDAAVKALRLELHSRYGHGVTRHVLADFERLIEEIQKLLDHELGEATSAALAAAKQETS